MEENMKEAGKMESKMDKGNTLQLVENKKWVYGRKEKKCK
jgi:hypothetical protein